MRFPLLLSIPLFAIAIVARADEPIQFTLGWHASLDAEGHIVGLQPIANERIDRVPQVRARLEQAIRGWQFIPGAVNGAPAKTESGLYVRATLVPDKDGNFRIRVDHAGMGGTIAGTVVPHYPPSAVRAHKTGEVVLRIAYDADGKITDAKLAPNAPSVDPALIAASVKAARAWTFTPEIVDGHALAGVSFVPFCYSLNNVESKCDWIPPGEHNAIGDGEAFAVNPAAHLITNVAGHLL